MSSKTMLDLFSSRFVLYYRNSRTLEWKAYVSMAILGFISNSVLAIILAPSEIFKFMLTTSLYLAFSFSINNSFDAKSDVLHKEKAMKNPIATGEIKFKEGIIFSSCLAIVGLLLTYCWFESCFSIYLSLIILSSAYSVPPIRLKSKPFLDLISHGMFFGILLYFYGVLASGGLIFQNIIVGFSIFIYSIILELRNHLKDFEVDLRSRTITTVCYLGYRKSLIALKVLLVFHWSFLSMASFIIRHEIAALPIFLSILFTLAGLKQIRSNRYLRIADLFTCIILLLLTLFREECNDSIFTWNELS